MTGKTVAVRDVIHNYIYLTRTEKPGEVTEQTLIDSEWVQRLRQVFQLQSAWFIYPNAVHSRFQHSLGVMHLAGEMAHRLYPMFKEAFPNEYIPEEPNHVEEIFRLAGLLHDIGHGPFGHLLDEVYTYDKFSKTHEDISSTIIKSELNHIISGIRRSPHGRFDEPISPKQITKFIKMPRSFKDYSLWEQVFAKIMMGIYSADAMDFLLRDQYFCGTSEFGKINFRNLIDNTLITRNGLTLNKNALPALRTFLQTRFNMFRHVYLYEKNELYDLAFGKLLPGVMKELRIGNPYKNLSRFKRVTDFGLHRTVPGWAAETGDKGKLGREWKKLLSRGEMPFVKVFEQENFYHTLGEASQIVKKDILHNELLNKYSAYPDVKVTISRNDVRLQNQFVDFDDLETLRAADNVKAVSLLDASTGEFCAGEGNTYIRDIPLKYEVIRVYIPEESSRKMNDPEEDMLQQGELFSGADVLINESELRDDITSM